MHTYKKCSFSSIEAMVSKYYDSNEVIVDSFWEDHVVKSTHYQILFGDVLIGFFAIFNEQLLTLFHITEGYAYLGQKIFREILQFEKVNNAFVPTGDEFFLSHASDSFLRVEKQAYFFNYGSTELVDEKRKNIILKRIETQEDTALMKIAIDFFEPDTEENILNGSNYLAVYKALDNGELVGFGVVEYGRISRSIASVGMYVLENKRKQHYATNILKELQKLVESKGYKARSGCWYYNHNSKKSIESAGGYSKTRLLRFYF